MSAATRRRKKREREADVTNFKMKAGQPHMGAIDPIISVVGHGPLAYIWVGDDRGCYATIADKQLRLLVGRFLSRRKKPRSSESGR